MISNGNEISGLNGLFVASCGREKMERESRDLDANYRPNRMIGDKLPTSPLFSKAKGFDRLHYFFLPKKSGMSTDLLNSKFHNSKRS